MELLQCQINPDLLLRNFLLLAILFLWARISWVTEIIFGNNKIYLFYYRDLYPLEFACLGGCDHVGNLRDCCHHSGSSVF